MADAKTVAGSCNRQTSRGETSTLLHDSRARRQVRFGRFAAAKHLVTLPGYLRIMPSLPSPTTEQSDCIFGCLVSTSLSKGKGTGVRFC